ncbi:uncharacterized protein N7458_001206 [Penicillium daleae]|uniref:F-box domain-containing protein n=1 Tax=Penicillium daleae TaxID=63821 RepID=A0AAD6G4Q3_9EURO|nr:uncharacterized protein N7458_001206 [Penicillium daleae]KAJ5459654.1 hypothetical protein N7458_001206 [Penicillium daleae]
MSDPAEYAKAIISSKEWAWATNPFNWHDQDELRRFVALDGLDESSRLSSTTLLTPISFEAGTQPSGPGTLSTLPLEIMFKVMDYLDISSVEALGQTCKMARSMIKKHPTYKILIKLVPTLRSAVEKCGLQESACLEDLAEELHYPYCRACGHQGTELFLPLGERVCFNCSTLSPAYWCMAVPDATAAFCLSEAQVREFPILKLKERFWAANNFLKTVNIDRQDLVPAKAAFLTAMKIWGNRKTMCRYAAPNDPDDAFDAHPDDAFLGAAYRFLRNMQVKAPNDPSQLDGPQPRLPEFYANMITVPFPYLPKGKTEIERRFMCRGCYWLAQQPRVEAAMLKYSDINPDFSAQRVKQMISGRRNTSYSWEELMMHIRGCAGAGFLMYQHVIERDYEYGLGNRLFWRPQ